MAIMKGWISRLMGLGLCLVLGACSSGGGSDATTGGQPFIFDRGSAVPEETFVDGDDAILLYSDGTNSEVAVVSETSGLTHTVTWSFQDRVVEISDQNNGAYEIKLGNLVLASILHKPDGLDLYKVTPKTDLFFTENIFPPNRVIEQSISVSGDARFELVQTTEYVIEEGITTKLTIQTEESGDRDVHSGVDFGWVGSATFVYEVIDGLPFVGEVSGAFEIIGRDGRTSVDGTCGFSYEPFGIVCEDSRMESIFF